MSTVSAQTELEFAPITGVRASPGLLREASHVLQQRLEQFLGSDQTFSVSPDSGKILVKLEKVDIDIETIVALCTTIGKLEFIDSEASLETGATYTGSGRVIFTDRDVQIARARSLPEFGYAVVDIELSSQGTDKLARYSRANIGHFLVIVKDGIILTSPMIQTEIPSGLGQLQNNFTMVEAQRLAAELTGRLPVPLELVRQN